ncbi:TetR family transcriptional regulator [Atlantibacter subterraneus]|uniref:TetR family transcriptional regulator n=1 Tax=Atlantibacter subterraneus TaxID=255519 RepID=A0A427V445_9ENTR|nr:TetR family transcriptional regulator [Atlantibacter subterranea]MDA3134817.1 TetR family transcriptional regulator [Atlantibacter subterranea]MDW2743085.1 TetR family transcriptional regulator [Atlantibacter subterranea]RSB63032.1 TetR family transcriptional regulator [Atlantibacter subterranea]RSE06101.1 TetR family transcriptional regulator [Atlantibacter subterranea]RSE27405.1 TetR family transcriptional regulator [Atlantibacter subterranea]
MRKTKLDAMRTRQLLIDTAIAEFARRGVSGTTLTDIADAAHVTRGAIYWHFSSKAELFNEIWKQQEEIKEKTQLITDENRDPLTLLRETLIAPLKAVAVDPKSRALMEILYHKCEFTADMISEYEIKNSACFDKVNLTKALKRCVESGQVSATINIDVTILLLQSCVNGIISNWLSQPEAFNLFALLEDLVDNMLKLLTTDNFRATSFPPSLFAAV